GRARARQDTAGALYVRARKQRGDGAAVRRERGVLEDGGVHGERRHLRCRGAADHLAAELGTSGSGPEHRAGPHRGGGQPASGTGTVLGRIIGAFIMSVLTNGLRIMSVAQEWQTVVTGAIIILAVYTDILRRARMP